MDKILVSARMVVNRKSPFVLVKLPEPAQTFWDDLCKAFREAAKSHQCYGLPVDNGGVNGQAIQINNLGKWLFGVPGYKGHVIYEPVAGDSFRVYYPDGAPVEVISLLRGVSAEAVLSKCRWRGNTKYKKDWMVNEFK